MNRILKIVILLIFVTVTSCKSTKEVVVNKEMKSISARKIIANHYHNNFDKKTIYAKLNAKYNDAHISTSISIKLRIETDKTIWMSATKLGIPIAKIKITPSKVVFYEKIKRTFFDGDFALLSKWLGIELDYKKVQNILLGQAILNLRKGKYHSNIYNNSYELKPKKNHELFGILFFMNPDNFKVDRQEVRNLSKNQQLFIKYPKYNSIKGEQFPKNIEIKANDSKTSTTIKLDYKSVEFNKDLTFPISVPNGYKEIILKQ